MCVCIYIYIYISLSEASGNSHGYGKCLSGRLFRPREFTNGGLVKGGLAIYASPLCNCYTLGSDFNVQIENMPNHTILSLSLYIYIYIYMYILIILHITYYIILYIYIYSYTTLYIIFQINWNSRTSSMVGTPFVNPLPKPPSENSRGRSEPP